MEKRSYLEKLPYYKFLTEEQKEDILKGWVTKTYKKGQLILGSDECLGQIFVISGERRAYVISEDGREITLFSLNEFDICVLSASCVIKEITFETAIVAETDCEVLILSSGLFQNLTEENIYVKCFMYELLTKRFSSVMFTMQQIIFKGYDRRLATFLISEYEKNGKREIKLTHGQIAKKTNSAREVVARMLKRFSSEGLVECERGTVYLLDTEKLKKLA